MSCRSEGPYCSLGIRNQEAGRNGSWEALEPSEGYKGCAGHVEDDRGWRKRGSPSRALSETPRSSRVF